MAQSTLYVNSATGNDTSAGTANAPLKTIARALQLVTSGSAIQLAAGTYNAATGEVFPLAIPAGVMVVGNESTKGKGILIEGSGEYISPSFGSQNITVLLAQNSQLRGVTVTNRATKGTGVWIESAAPLLANNTFTNCTREGVFVTGTAKPLIFDNLFVQNTSSGISMLRNAKGEIRRNVFREMGYGMALGDRAAPLIADNQIVANRIGITLSREVRPVFRQNLVEKNLQTGLVASDSAQPELGSRQDPAGNIFRDNGNIDLQNTTNATLTSAGNQLSASRVQGAVDFVPTQFPSRPLGPNQFSDVAGHWAEGFIQALVNRGVISGFPDGSFQPDANITRAQYAAIVNKTFELPAKRQGIDFKDVPGNFWAAAAIRKATTMGFIAGFPDATFRPGQNLTRIQAISSIVGGLGLTGGNPSYLNVYGDRAQIPSYATATVAIATQKRLIVNYPQLSQLNPMRDITRAEVAALIYQALVALGQANAIASPYIVTPEPAAVPSFADIQVHWAEDFIRRLVDRDLISGFTDGTFKPETAINRAQYAALLIKAFNPSNKRPAAQFADIPPNFWAAAVIQQAYRGGFLSGFPDQTFRPSQNVLKLQLILSLVSGLALPGGDEKLLAIYEDRDDIPAYARPAVAAATQHGIVVNYPHVAQLTPKREASRAETAAIVYQALVSVGRVSAVSSPYIVSRLLN